MLDADSAAILAVAKRIHAFGSGSRYGYRMPGTAEDHATARFLARELEAIGAEQVTLEEVPLAVAFPERWSLQLEIGGVRREVPCSFVRYAGYTPDHGIEAEVVHLGKGTPEDFAGLDLSGRIVAVELAAPGGMPHSGPPYAVFDAQQTIPADAARFAWPLVDIVGSYARAVAAGAAGWIGILELFGDDTCEYHHWYARHELPALTISARDGRALRSASGKVTARMTLTGSRGQGVGYNVYGTIPAANGNDEWVLLKSHYDGWATNEASGAAATLAAARLLREGPSLERNVLVMFRSSHFGIGWTLEPPGDAAEIAEATAIHDLKPGWDRFKTLVAKLLPRIAVGNNIEMISRQYEPLPQGGWAPTTRAAIRLWGISGPAPRIPNPALLDGVSRAIAVEELDRSIVSPFMVGDGMELVAMGLPMVSHISHNAYQFTSKDTPESIMVEDLGKVARAFARLVRTEARLPFESFGFPAPYSLDDLIIPGGDPSLEQQDLDVPQ